MNLIRILAVSVTMLLSACGGGGDDLPSNNSQQSAEGIWSGDVKIDNVQGKALGMVLSDGRYFFRYGASSYDNLAFGKASVSGSNISSNDLKLFVSANNRVSNASFSGTVTTNSKLNLNFSNASNAASGTGSLDFNNAYNNPSDLDIISGLYKTPNDTYVVQKNGIFEGTLEGKQITGQIKTINKSKNLYNIVFNYNNQEYSGAATYGVTGTKQLFFIAISNPDGNVAWASDAPTKQ
jgi:hypothetical protein